MNNLFLSTALLISAKAIAGVPFCNISQLNLDGTPTTNAAVKEFILEEKLTLQTPDSAAELSSSWNDSFGFYQMTLVAKGIEVNSIIEKPAKSGMLNLWIGKSEGYTAQCRFELE
jgi:hypothetical protein